MVRELQYKSFSRSSPHHPTCWRMDGCLSNNKSFAVWLEYRISTHALLPSLLTKVDSTPRFDNLSCRVVKDRKREKGEVTRLAIFRSGRPDQTRQRPEHRRTTNRLPTENSSPKRQLSLCDGEFQLAKSAMPSSLRLLIPSSICNIFPTFEGDTV